MRMRHSSVEYLMVCLKLSSIISFFLAANVVKAPFVIGKYWPSVVGMKSEAMTSHFIPSGYS